MFYQGENPKYSVFYMSRENGFNIGANHFATTQKEAVPE